MKVYVVPYGKDTKVYASREAAEKARDRIAYNIEMSGSNNPTPPVVETEVLEESLNESSAKEESLDDYGNYPAEGLIEKAELDIKSDKQKDKEKVNNKKSKENDDDKVYLGQGRWGKHIGLK